MPFWLMRGWCRRLLMKPLFLEPLLEVWALPPRANTTAVRTADFPLGRPQSNRVRPGQHGLHCQQRLQKIRMAWVSCTSLSSTRLTSCTAVLTAIVFPLGDTARNSKPVELGWCTNGRSAAAYDHHICNGQVPVLIFLLHRCC